MKKIILTLLPLIVLNCSLLNEEKNSNITIRTNFTSDSRALVGQISQITLKVTANDMDDYITVSTSNAISAVIPKGKERTFKLTLELADGSIYSGSTTVDLVNTNEEVFITLVGLLDSFTLKKSVNTSLINDISGYIYGNTIHLGLPKTVAGLSTFDISNLIADITHRGTTVNVGTDYNTQVVCEISDLVGNVSKYYIKTFQTFLPKLVDIIEPGVSPAFTEPDLTYIDGKVYIAYADQADKPAIKVYDPNTGIVSENIFNANAAVSPRYFKVSGSSENNLYFTYVGNTNIYIYHYNGANWSLKAEKVAIGRDDVSITTFNDLIYIGTMTPSYDYVLYNYDTNANSGITEVFFRPSLWADCITNSLYVVNENSIFINVLNSSALNAYYYNGATFSDLTGTPEGVDPANPESVFTSGYDTIESKVLIDIKQPGPPAKLKTIAYESSSAKSGITPDIDSSSGIVRSFFDKNTYGKYRILVGLGPQQQLYKHDGFSWNLLWSIPNESGMKMTKVINNGNNVFVIYYLSGTNELKIVQAAKY